MSVWVRSIVAALVLSLLTACSGLDLPRDPSGTLQRARGGTLLVGVSENPPHTAVSDEGSVSGEEAEILRGYAESIDADIEWTAGAESQLMAKLREKEIDVVIGGLASDSPWSTHAAFTRPYDSVIGEDGEAKKLVLGVRLGENALLTSIERFLIAEGLEP